MADVVATATEEKLGEPDIGKMTAEETTSIEASIEEKPAENGITEEPVENIAAEEASNKEATAEEATPEESKPEESKPDESKPEESKPEESNPEESGKITNWKMTQDIASVEDAREFLRKLREDNLRQSNDVIHIYDAFIGDCDPSDLGEEHWMILEQVVVAGFDTHRKDIVDICMKELATMFSMNSLRMRRLEAMRAEMFEEYEEALLILDSIIQEDDSNSQARKRKIAILKDRSKHQEAIAELVKYLKDYMADGEAWMELCDLYILEQDYAKAAFCCEELILQHPHNHLYYQRYA